MSKISKKRKKLLREQLMKEGGKSSWKEFSTLRRQPKIQNGKVIQNRKHKKEKYPHLLYTIDWEE